MRLIIFLIALIVFALGVYFFIVNRDLESIACLVGVAAILALKNNEPRP